MEVEQQHEVKIYNSLQLSDDCDIDVLASEGESDEVKNLNPKSGKRNNINNNIDNNININTDEETNEVLNNNNINKDDNSTQQPQQNDLNSNLNSESSTSVLESDQDCESIDASSQSMNKFEFVVSGKGISHFEIGKINYFQIHVNSTMDFNVDKNKNNPEPFLIDNLSVILNNSLEKDLSLDAFIQPLDSNLCFISSYFPVRIPTNKEYELHVRYEGKEVNGSPWRVEFKQETKNKKRKYEEPKIEEGTVANNDSSANTDHNSEDTIINIMASPQKRIKLDNNSNTNNNNSSMELEGEINIMD